MTTENNWYKIENKAGETPVIYLYDVIGGSFFDEGTDAKGFAAEFKAITDKKPKNIHVRINSPGGRIIDGTAIFNLMLQHKEQITVFVDGIAASIAAMIAVAGKKVVMAKNSLFMIHNPSGCACGNSKDLRAMAELMDTMGSQMANSLVDASGNDLETVKAQMDAETWFTSEEAVEAGYAHEISDTEAVAFASANKNLEHGMLAKALKGMPEIKPTAKAEKVEENTMADEHAKAATLAELEAALPSADAGFILEQLKAEATVADALSARNIELEAKLEATNKAKDQSEAQAKADAEAAKLKAEAEAKKGGNDALGGGGDEGAGFESPIAEFRDAITAKTKQGMSRIKAVCAVTKENPELHAAYMEAATGKGA